jgi:hypothetical protein
LRIGGFRYLVGPFAFSFMAKTPPLLPAEVLRRVLWIAQLGGTVVLAVSGLLAVLFAGAGDYLGAAIGVIIAGAGVFELHGASLLRAGWPNGINWLVGSQLYLLVTILSYCALRLSHQEIPELPPEAMTMIELSAQQLGLTAQAYMTMLYRFSFFLVAGLTLLYQGGMAFYYHRRRTAVMTALLEQGLADSEPVN